MDPRYIIRYYKLFTYGFGAIASPFKIQVYSIPSGLVNFKIALLYPIVKGSYLILTDISTPFGLSAGGAATYGTSDLKSLTPG